MMTRVHHAKDLDSGIELRALLLGHLMRLELHHIFPKAKLYKTNDYSKPEVNSLANFMFLTQDTNLQISDKDPERYFTHYEEKNPGVLASQWIPMEPALWRYENYRDFLAARRELLANAANGFLNSLYQGAVPEAEPSMETPSIDVGMPVPRPAGGTAPAEEETLLLYILEWIAELQLPDGDLYFELADSESGEPQAVFDLAWPNGLQQGLSQPVALLLDEPHYTEAAANKAGYRYFTDIDSFKSYVLSEVTASDMAAD
jgi:hypothetical protein